MRTHCCYCLCITIAHTENMDDATLAKTYQKLEQHEHVLKLPWMYVGSVKPITEKQHVFDEATQRIVYREITYVPGLYKIFDEILVNASDNKQRDQEQTMIKVDLNAESGEVRVWNNGSGIPVKLHPKHGVYIPELIFGSLNSGSNFDDDTTKVTGGRHGLGAKLTNILSTEFKVDTSSTLTGKRFEQTFRRNMTERDKPRIRKALKRDYTCVTFRPDFARFGGLRGFDTDTLALFKKRVYDIAGCNSDLNVSLNGKLIKISSFKQYAMLYYPPGAAPKPVPLLQQHDTQGRCRWEVIVLPSRSGTEFEQVSFVNAIHTSRGGRHVTHVLSPVLKYLHEKAKQKYRTLAVKPAHVRNRVCVFINALINNPEFDSQTKETLRSVVRDFGTTFTPDKEFLARILKTNVLDGIGLAALEKAQQQLNKTSGKKRKRVNVPKLVDANEAGGRNAAKCTLILTEGDSAKALALAGLAVTRGGADYYGVFPLRGKLLNVRDASMSKIASNAEVNAINTIMGLQMGHKYTSVATLRYGCLMIMADQDVDGFHIKALVINYIQHFWPELAQQDGFLSEFITPLVRCRRKTNETPLDFFNEPSFRAWYECRVREGNAKQWHIKYYKGLGTSTNREAKEYFSNIHKHKRMFKMDAPERVNSLLNMTFSKANANARKTWLQAYNPKVAITTREQSGGDEGEVVFHEFIDNEFRLFGLADCERTLPNVMDGLKVSQRKILYACRKRNLTRDLKVAQLSGYVTEHSGYHHGEVSMQQAITNMAQTFMWSNNVNLLEPSGQFGQRNQGGKDAASARYIETHLTPIASVLFDARDNALLSYCVEDNMQVEPHNYMPVLPYVLFNGHRGIATGFSVNVPAYNPRDVMANVKRALEETPLIPMLPWFRGFTGHIERDGKNPHKYHSHGVWQRTESGVLITELPYGVWTESYEEFLKKCMDATTPDTPTAVLRVDDYARLSAGVSSNAVCIRVHSKQIGACDDDATVTKWLKLSNAVIRTSNMNLYDADGAIRKFTSPEEIIEYYVPRRLTMYVRRREHCLTVMREAMTRIENEWRFLGEVCSGTFRFQKRSKAEMEVELDEKKYMRLGAKLNYAYLIKKPLYAASTEKMAQLNALLMQKKVEYEALQNETPTSLWLRDLAQFEEALQAHEAHIMEDNNFDGKNGDKLRKRKRVPGRKASRQRKKVKL